MDNLERIQSRFMDVSQDGGEIVSCTYREGETCILRENNTLFVYKANNSKSKTYTIPYNEESIIHTEYLSMENRVFLASKKHFVIFDEESEETTVEPTNHDEICVLSWNPAQTALVTINVLNYLHILAYSDGMVCIMHKVSLNIPMPTPINVGWGSQTSQFEGPGQKKKKNVEPNQHKILENHQLPVISWRGNCEQFVINYEKYGKRFLRTFTSELVPLFESMEYLNLQHPTSFMERGQCIACCAVRYLQEKKEYDLVIFEKNCLVKEIYSVPQITDCIQKVLYHPQMAIMVILSADIYSHIYIYMFSNNKWFLKQHLLYRPGVKVYDLNWENLAGNLFTICRLVVFTSENIEHHTFRFVVNNSSVAAVTAIVDGSTVEFYNYDNSVVPPPMFLTKFSHTQPINHIFFHPDQPMCLLIDSNYQIIVLSFKDIVNTSQFNRLKVDNNSDVITDSILARVNIQNLKAIPNFINVTFKNENEIVINVKIDSEGTYMEMYENIGEIEIKIKTEKTDTQSSYFDSTQFNMLKENINLIKVCITSVTVDMVERVLAFALSNYREFYVNNRLVLNGVTSMFVFKKYLLLTHENNKFYCIRIIDDDLINSTLHLSEKFAREIEQGARLLQVTDSKPPKIIFCLPRGNIETITSMLITIDILENLLQQNEWRKAIDIAKREKLNWNVLIDLNPIRFLEHVSDFVKGSSKPNVLVNIVNGFNVKENCFNTIYKHYFTGDTLVSVVVKMKVIEEILNFLKTSTDLFTTLCCIVAIELKHYSLETALKSIKKVYLMKPPVNLEEAQKKQFLCSKDKLCEKALKQIFAQEYYGNVLKAAYGLFNFDFLHFIYYNTNEDPLIFEPKLKNLNDFPLLVQRFQMCLEAENFKRAIKYLIRIDSLGDDYVMNFIYKNHVEMEAYRNITANCKHYKLVVKMYAKKLSLEHKFDEAGFILKQAELYEEALEMYKKDLDWKEALCLMVKLELDEEHKKEILDELAEHLCIKSRFEDALFLLEVHSKNYGKAEQLLMKYKQFRRAFWLAKLHGRNIECIIAAYKEYLNDLLIGVESLRNKFEEYLNRLIILRIDRENKLKDNLHNDEEDDLFSESGSTIYSQVSGRSQRSSRTLKSTLSSKNRRKEEKKKISLKVGNYYEDIALIRALHCLYDEIFHLGKIVREACLIEHMCLETGQKLHTKLKQLQDDIILKIPEIWPDVFIKPIPTSDPAVLAIIQNRNEIDPKYATPPTELDQSWTLDIFL